MFELIYLKWSDFENELVEITVEFKSEIEAYDFIDNMTSYKKLIHVIKLTFLGDI